MPWHGGTGQNGAYFKQFILKVELSFDREINSSCFRPTFEISDFLLLLECAIKMLSDKPYGKMTMLEFNCNHFRQQSLFSQISTPDQKKELFLVKIAPNLLINSGKTIDNLSAEIFLRLKVIGYHFGQAVGMHYVYQIGK